MAIDTSTPYLVLAAAEDSVFKAGLLRHKSFNHGRNLIPSLQTLLRKAKWSLDRVDWFAFGAGPGSYTGLRIGLAAAKALKCATDSKVALFSSLRAIAENLPKTCGRGVVAVDAKRGKLYAVFVDVSEQGVRRVSAAKLVSPQELVGEIHEFPLRAKKKQKIFVAGDGASLLQSLLEEQASVQFLSPRLSYPMPAGLVRAAWEQIRRKRDVDLRHIKPAYMRLSEAEETRRAKRKK